MSERTNFLTHIIDTDLASGRVNSVYTRFPPEPNGYLHIGHAKSICLNFSIANRYDGQCNLRFDDTNPEKETPEYVASILEDVAWLGFTPTKICYASDYFEQLYTWAKLLISKGVAYVDDQTAEEISAGRGSLTEPGTNSPFRGRSVEENLSFFEAMRNGEFEDGSKVLRAKIDMAHPNMSMRDPAMYRIRRATHHRTGDDWCIYPMYDFAHGQSDAIEGITHSFCTLEFSDHRPLYDWFLDQLDVNSPRPIQTEFARLNIADVSLSKRHLLQLVETKQVESWDDPRMPTISGIRRKGVPAAAVRNFCDAIGVAKAQSEVDPSMFNHEIRQILNNSAARRMVVVDPVKLVLTNFDDDQVESLKAINNPEDDAAGERIITMSKEIWVERSDIRLDANKKWFRFSQNKEVRLLHGFYVKVDDIICDEDGEFLEIRASYDPETRGGWSEDGRRVKGTVHWVDSATCQSIDLIKICEPSEGQSVGDLLRVSAVAEPIVVSNPKQEPMQFVRTGYYQYDAEFSSEKPTYIETVAMRDSFKG